MSKKKRFILKKGLDENGISKLAEVLRDEIKTPRAVAILSAAYIDNLLNELLMKRLVQGDKASDIVGKLTYERRVLLCFLTGIFGRKVKEDLLTIGSIRNSFAHNISINSFNKKNISKYCEELNCIKYLNEKRADFPSSRIPLSTPEAKFMGAFMLYMAVLTIMHIGSGLQRIKEGSEFWH